MSSPATNPVLAPIRRWVLYSRTNLTITIVSTLGVLFLAGAVFGQSPTAASAGAHTATGAPTTTAVGATATAGALSYELTEVTESEIAGRSATSVAGSAPATAMTYAHVYIDQALSNSDWKTKLGQHTAEAPSVTVVNARPTIPVAITGSTRSETVAGTGGESAVQVTIPTQAGNLRVTLKAADSGSGSVWRVQNPLPTLDRSEIDKLGTPTLASVPTITTTAPTTTPTTTNAPSPTTHAPTTSATVPPAELGPTPVPVPGPIPIPDLDTPLPGTL